MKSLVRSLVALAVIAIAAPSYAQVNLSWNDCGSAGQAARTFACNANTGAPHVLIGSFIAPANANNVVGIEAVLDLINDSASLVNWWNFTTGNCRANALSYDFNFSVNGPFTCVDFWAGAASGGGGMEVNGAGKGPNTARVKIVCATAAGAAMTPGDEIYGFKANIINQNTTTCTGCATATCIVLNEVKVVQPAGVGDFSLTGAPNGGRDNVTFNGTTANCSTVPTLNRTWGQIKGLYR